MKALHPPPGAVAPLPEIPPAATRLGRALRFFFLHLGTLLPILVYFSRAEAARWALPGVADALAWALGVHLAYALLARAVGELKQFDLGILAFWALGLVAVHVGPAWLAALYQRYSPALLFVAFGTTALVPLVVGGPVFTEHFARRQTPRWQLALPEFAAINRVIAGFWVAVFYAAAAIAAARPTEPLFTALLPNLVVLLIGLPAAVWVPPLYLRLFPPALPQRVEALVLGMPMAFDRRAAGNVTASFQFHVSGADGGDWCVCVADGRCASFVGTAAAPDLVIRAPDAVWLRIARGELDGREALIQGLYTVHGDLTLLPKLSEWFGGARR